MTIGLKLKLLTLAWTVGLLGRLVVSMLQLVGLVRVEGAEHLRELVSTKEGFLAIHRHPSMPETVIIPLLFFPHFLWNPWRMPVATPDERNYYRPWWFAIFRPMAIPVPRGNRAGEIRALRRMLQVLGEGRPLVIAPEGGRTFKGKEFVELSGDGRVRVFHALGRELNLSLPIVRRFKDGLQALYDKGIPVLPVWVNYEGWSITISFGAPVVFQEGEKPTTEEIEQLLLSAYPRP